MKKGHHMTETAKANLRKHRLGKPLSEAHRAKVIKTLNRGKGKENGYWKGGKTMQGGYVIIRCPNHPRARSNGYYPEHRLVMEQSLGRYLNREEVVHHINGIKTDNRIENLVLTTHQEHAQSHWGNPDAKAAQSEMMKEVRSKKFWSTRPNSHTPTP